MKSKTANPETIIIFDYFVLYVVLRTILGLAFQIVDEKLVSVDLWSHWWVEVGSVLAVMMLFISKHRRRPTTREEKKLIWYSILATYIATVIVTVIVIFIFDGQDGFNGLKAFFDAAPAFLLLGTFILHTLSLFVLIAVIYKLGGRVYFKYIINDT